MAAPWISTRFSGRIGGPPSAGSPDPVRTRPSISRDTESLIVSPRNFTLDARSIPAVPSKIWTTTTEVEESRTWPRLRRPSGRKTSTSSLYPTGSVFSTKISGPAISEIVRDSFATSVRLPSLEVVVHHRERLLELLIELFLVLDAREELAALDPRDVFDWHVEGERLLAEVRVLADRRDELVLPRRRAERVDGVVGVLLQEDLADHPGDLERELLLRRQRVRADEPYDLFEFRLLLERPLRPLPQLRPLLVDLRPEPILQGVAVQAVGREPVDRREMPPRAQCGVERPEHLHDPQGALGDRLGEVAPARRDRADDGDGGFAVVQRRYATGALVELAESGRQVSGKAFFSGHLLEAARDLPHRLGPPRCGVGHEGHVVTHVSVVLRKRHPGVHGRLSRRNGHVARVRDQRHPLQEWRTGVRILELWECREDFRHFVPALPAADVDDDLRVAPLRKLLLGDRLSRSEAPGDCGGPSFRDREEEVHHPLARDQGNGRHEPILRGSRLPHGPILLHHELAAVVEFRDDLVDFHLPRPDASDLAGDVRRHEDPVLDVLGLLDRAEHLAALDRVALLHRGPEVPLLLSAQPRRAHAAEDEVPHDLFQDGQRPLHAVVDVPEESGPEFDREGLARVRHRLAGPDAGRLLVHLDDRLVAEDLDDLPHQLLGPDEHDVVHARAEPDRGHDGPSDALDGPRALDVVPGSPRARRHPTTSLEQIDADRPLHLGPEVLVFRRTDPDDHGSGDRLEPPPHRMAQALHIRGVEDEDPDLRVVEDLRKLPLDLLLRRRDGAAHADELEPLHEVVPADRGDLHLTPPGALGGRPWKARSPARGR